MAITASGYIRVRANGRWRMEHDVVWEAANGPIPDGHMIHHRDFTKTNNILPNLQLVTPLEHKRIHSGCVLVEGRWIKPCSVCGESKVIDAEHWYLTPEGWPQYGRCKSCHNAIMREKMRARRAAARE